MACDRGCVPGFPALAAACNGAASLARLDGNTRFIAGMQDALYEGSGGSWTDVSATTYAIGDAKWRFAQFGNTSLAIFKAIQACDVFRARSDARIHLENTAQRLSTTIGGDASAPAKRPVAEKSTKRLRRNIS